MRQLFFIALLLLIASCGHIQTRYNIKKEKDKSVNFFYVQKPISFKTVDMSLNSLDEAIKKHHTFKRKKRRKRIGKKFNYNKKRVFNLNKCLKNSMSYREEQYCYEKDYDNCLKKTKNAYACDLDSNWRFKLSKN